MGCRGGLSPPTRGNPYQVAGASGICGLSPPTRGNLRFVGDKAGNVGSIPAHAGEPGFIQKDGLKTEVYPRPRGGTVNIALGKEPHQGLSPPTRGNRMHRSDLLVLAGSIPAHAGEPRRARALPFAVGVYPRPRGGTRQNPLLPVRFDGLSPPTRGNRAELISEHGRRGSIPAHAGEPEMLQAEEQVLEVYPRPRGGTASASSLMVWPSGLSPPTRGNLKVKRPSKRAMWSIPAHAGEPLPARGGGGPSPVYPRPRGGTWTPCKRHSMVVGLSPPTRGNPSA